MPSRRFCAGHIPLQPRVLQMPHEYRRGAVRNEHIAAPGGESARGTEQQEFNILDRRQCARNGISPIGCHLYSSFFPCVNCAIAIVQSGIQQVITYEPEATDEHWAISITKSRDVFTEAGVDLLEFRLSDSLA